MRLTARYPEKFNTERLVSDMERLKINRLAIFTAAALGGFAFGIAIAFGSAATQSGAPTASNAALDSNAAVLSLGHPYPPQ